ncbi:hypothetical protein VNO80_06084 [Phaseolus coccineus]|uniref:Uncharacterized protein n=1 Tax=Phaseolus coccineus TaxID=3886 RepID=A0AAN9NL03_PHACN
MHHHANVVLEGFAMISLKSCTLSSFSGEDKSSDENNLKKGPWTAAEDDILAEYVRRHGTGNWNIVQKNTGLARCGKSCRLRWTNHLRPDLRRGAFSNEEQRKVIELHALMGNKWAKMAQELPGRTDNEIKNFWNTRLKKRKRVGLGIYPDDIKPVFNAHNSETDQPTYTHSANDSGVGSSSCVSREVFNNFNTPNQPHFVPPISEVPADMQCLKVPQEMMQLSEVPEEMMQLSEVPEEMMRMSEVPEEMLLQEYDEFLEDFMYGGDYECSGGPSSISELPPLPSSRDALPFEESMVVVREVPQAETNQHYIPRSPRSNGYLESIFYPPKVSQEPENYSNMQGELNAGNRENSSEQRKHENEDILSNFIWVEEDRSDPIKDTLYSVIHPFFPR